MPFYFTFFLGLLVQFIYLSNGGRRGSGNHKEQAMGFAMGSSSSSLTQTPIRYNPFLSGSSSSSSQSLYFCCCSRNGHSKTKTKLPISCFLPEKEKSNSVLTKRKAFLVLGLSLFPLMHSKARALENERAARTTEEIENSKQPIQIDEPSNPFLSLLNGIGIFSTGVTGAFYAITQQEKKAAEETIKSIKSELEEKEATLVSVKNEYERKLLNEQQERTKQLKKSKEEQQESINQLNSATSTITRLGQELQREKRVIEDLKVEIFTLQTNLSEAGEDKKVLDGKLKEKLDMIEVLQQRTDLLSLEIKEKADDIQNLSSSLSGKELEVKKLNAAHNLSKDELANANREIKGLREDLMRAQEELVSKSSEVDDLNARISALITEKNDSDKRNDEIQKKYNGLKSSSEMKAASAARVLGEREKELNHMKQQLEIALNDVSESKEIISSVSQAKEDLGRMLDLELNNVKNLKHELHLTQESLGKSRNEVSDLGIQLQQSQNLCSDLEAEVSKVRTEFAKSKEVLHRDLAEAQEGSEMLTRELTTTNELLKKAEDELLSISDQLAAAEEKRYSLQKELADVYKKAEFGTNELKEEKRVVSSLKKELQAIENQIVKDKETRKSLEMDLEEAIKSLDEMNKNALLLSRNLDLANSRISSLEEEKDVLYKSVAEQKQITQEIRDNMEDAHNLVMKLGKERGNLDKRAKKLEEDLASAKGEILRLRSKINSSKSPDIDNQPKDEDPEEAVVVSAKKTTRRKKSSPQ